jgi:hypothetical protein
MSALYYVPVRQTQRGTLAVRTGRLVDGNPVGLAFTSEESLIAVYGPWQSWIRIDLEALRQMLLPVGVAEVRVDPLPAAMVAAAA